MPIVKVLCISKLIAIHEKLNIILCVKENLQDGHGGDDGWWMMDDKWYKHKGHKGGDG
jgi:hypothetical protein